MSANVETEVSKLEGDALDWAVAKCEGCEEWFFDNIANIDDDKPYAPSIDWAQGGPIIEREGINLFFIRSGVWQAETDTYEDGPSPLIAAMRLYVAGELGDEIYVPAELVKAKPGHVMKP